MSPLQADAIFACLERHGVAYVVIGGLAAVLHGSPLPTFDVDICPASDRANLDLLAGALREMDARIRTPDDPGGVRFPFDGVFLAGVQLLNLVTRWGDLDLSFQPAGTSGFVDLDRQAVTLQVGPSSLKVAALEDVIRSKAAANRPKDQRALPVLRQLLSEIERARGGAAKGE